MSFDFFFSPLFKTCCIICYFRSWNKYMHYLMAEQTLCFMFHMLKQFIYTQFLFCNINLHKRRTDKEWNLQSSWLRVISRFPHLLHIWSTQQLYCVTPVLSFSLMSPTYTFSADKPRLHRLFHPLSDHVGDGWNDKLDRPQANAQCQAAYVLYTIHGWMDANDIWQAACFMPGWPNISEDGALVSSSTKKKTLPILIWKGPIEELIFTSSC